MIKYILFDLDGTLTESAPGITNSIKHTYKHYGITDYDEAELHKFVGPPLIESFMRYCGFTQEKASEAVDVYREYFSTKGLFENAVYGGIPECLETLKNAGFKLAVATSKPQVFCERILEHFDLAKYFDVVKGIPLDDEQMTKAQVIAYALGALGVTDKIEAVMIGDRDYDVKGAKENGISCVGVLYGYGSRSELESAGAICICDTVEALTKYLMQSAE